MAASAEDQAQAIQENSQKSAEWRARLFQATPASPSASEGRVSAAAMRLAEANPELAEAVRAQREAGVKIAEISRGGLSRRQMLEFSEQQGAIDQRVEIRGPGRRDAADNARRLRDAPALIERLEAIQADRNAFIAQYRELDFRVRELPLEKRAAVLGRWFQVNDALFRELAAEGAAAVPSSTAP